MLKIVSSSAGIVQPRLINTLLSINSIHRSKEKHILHLDTESIPGGNRKKGRKRNKTETGEKRKKTGHKIEKENEIQPRRKGAYSIKLVNR